MKGQKGLCFPNKMAIRGTVLTWCCRRPRFSKILRSARRPAANTRAIWGLCFLRPVATCNRTDSGWRGIRLTESAGQVSCYHDS